GPSGPQPEGLGGRDAGQGQVAGEGRKKGAAARRPPWEGRPERRRLDRNQQEVVLAGEMLCGGFAHLLGSGEVDVAVGAVDRGAAKDAVAPGLLPQGARGDLVDQSHDGAASTDNRRGRAAAHLTSAFTSAGLARKNTVSP